MAFFNKNTQLKNDELQERVLETESQPEMQTQLDVNQLEASLHELAEKIRREKEKTNHLIEVQTEQLEQLESELNGLKLKRDAAQSYQSHASNTPGGREIFRQQGELAELYSKEIMEQKKKIDRVELDIETMKLEKDTESINALLDNWSLYEDEIFEAYIFPAQQAAVAAKQKYFESLNELRSYYSNLERIAIHLNEVLSFGDKLKVYNWFEVIRKNPEWRITKYDEQKEDTLINTYRGE